VTQLIPTPYTVAHISRQLDTQGAKDSHGNYQMEEAAPVLRQVQSINQVGRLGSSRAVFTTETSNREEVTLHMAVPNPEVYASGDQVLIGPVLDVDGNYVPGSGTAYWVNGDPTDDRKGPWPRYLKHFGGVVKLRRVT
jgi:hypothetical protein